MFEKKKKNLLEMMNSFAERDVCVAFSGGVDSSILLKLACDSAMRHHTTVYAVTFETNLHPQADLAIAKKVAMETGAKHIVLEVNEFDNPDILKNPVNRCFLCKKMLFTKLLDFAADKKINCVIEGTNEDDLHVFRPGLQAVRELKVHSPLAEAGLTKQEVRCLAEEYGLSVSKRPSAPCLATRLPYDTVIDPEVLHMIDLGEQFLKDMGFNQVRIRQHGDITRIEVSRESFASVADTSDVICRRLQEIGFRYITMDLQGFRSGSMDEYLQK